MKVKSIIACGLLLLGMGAATTSCEDMFEAENKLVTTDLAPNDTVYQMMGIVQRMQKLAERTVLLGEVRADLLDVDPVHATAYLQGLYNNDPAQTQPYDPIKKTGNIYNQPADYYAVINSCNIYLAYVDSLLKTHGVYYYEKEVCATKCFRAWCYLELAKIYGEVPYVTKPVLTSDAAENIVANENNMKDMEYIVGECIKDLLPYAYMDKNQALLPSYSGKWGEISYSNFFIPVRALLAELYLWKGTCTKDPEDYKKAAGMYHDFFCYPNEERGVTANRNITWSQVDGKTFRGTIDSYFNRFKVEATRENIAVLPCDTSALYGNYNDLSEIFNSMYKNNYYPAVAPSQRVRDISSAQKFCFYNYVSASENYVVYGSDDESDYVNSLQRGDLRLYSIYDTESNLSASKYNSNFNTVTSNIFKWLNGNISAPKEDVRQSYVPYYRTPILYLHMAEALNRAGFPETAYMVLAYGIDYTVLNGRISKTEFDGLCEIKSLGAKLSAREESQYDEETREKTRGTFVIWPSTVFVRPDKRLEDWHTEFSWTGGYQWQMGIHSLGSGDTEYNEYYYLDDDDTKEELLLGVLDEFPGIMIGDELVEDNEDVYAIITYMTGDGEEVEVEYATEEEYTEAVDAYNQYISDFYTSDKIMSKRQARVAELILEEEALEGMFEGYRFYDLMRYQMQNGVDIRKGKYITMPEYITKKYGEPRDGMKDNKPWFLSLPQR